MTLCLDSLQERAQNSQLPCRLWAKRFRRFGPEVFEHVKKQAAEVSHGFLLCVACRADVPTPLVVSPSISAISHLGEVRCA
jgi:hypothetical protein